MQPDFDRTFADQASKYATRTPMSFDTTVREILRTIPGNPHAVEQLQVLTEWAERGRAWHPAMGVQWDTAEQAAQR